MEDVANNTGLNELKLTEVMASFFPLLKEQIGLISF